MKKKNYFNRNLIVIFLLLFICRTNYAQENLSVELINSGELIKKGIMYYDKGQYDKAIETYKKVSRNDTNYSWALYEMSMTYSEQKKYDEGIECCEQGLKLFDKSNEVSFFIEMANDYDYLDSNEKALNIYKEALELYPYSQSLIYNNGVALYKNKNYDEAEKLFLRSLSINPYHSNSHMYLGYINIIRGRMMPALLCLNTALLMNPVGKRGDYYLSVLEQAYSGELEKELKNDSVIYQGEVNTNFQDIETLIKSEFVLNRKYKTEANLNYIPVRQAQLIFDQLKEDKEQKDFYTRFYVPLFRFIADKGFIEVFSFYIMQSKDNDEIKNWIGKKDAKVKKFIDVCSSFISDKRKFGFDPENEKSKKIYYFFSERNTLMSFGSFEDKNEKVRSGEWSYFYSNGALETKQNFKNGKLNGSSTFYKSDRSIDKIFNYVDDKVEGQAVFYNIYGEKDREFTIKNGLINGIARYYNSSGYPDQTLTFVDGKTKGAGKVFYSNGQLKQEFTKIDNKYQGDVKTYHPNGLTDLISTLKDDKYNGGYVDYYPNGNKKTEGKYDNGKLIGKWIEYYSTGQIKSETEYNDKGNITGTVKSYFLDGKLKTEENYGSNGKMSGKSSYYDYDGKLYNEFIYRNDKLDELFFYDKNGKVIKHIETKKGVLTMEYVYPNGNLSYSGTFNDGLRDGLFKDYNSSGILESEQNYKNGKKEGKFVLYYPNGKAKRTANYKDNKLDSYFIEYYPNGIVSEEGWYKDGNMQGDWYQYHLNGIIARHSYYVNGKNHGFIEYYNPNGKKYLEYFYNQGLFLRYTQFDSIGSIYNDCELKAGKGKLKKLNPNGTTFEISNMIMGEKYDTVKQYNINGTLTYYGLAFDGDKDGLVKTYNDDGQLINEANYIFGKKEGIEKEYEDEQLTSLYEYVDGEIENTAKIYQDGKLKIEASYKNGDKEGYTTYYAPDGQVAYRLFYVRGNMVSYSYLDKTGKFVSEIPIVDGKGKVVAYFKNGKKSVDFEMFNGERNGLKIDYYPDGKVKEEYNYLDGLYHGIAKEYYSSGKLKKEAEYSYDYRIGTTKLYFQNGNIKKEIPYDNNQYNGLVKIFNQNGKIIKTRKYHYGFFIEETNIR